MKIFLLIIASTLNTVKKNNLKQLFKAIRQKIDYIYIAILFVLFIGLMYSIFIASLSMWFLVGFWIFEWNFQKKINLLLQNKNALIFISVFFVYIIGLSWSKNLTLGINEIIIKLPILIFPLIFSTITPLNKKQIDFILYMFLAVVFSKTMQGLYFILRDNFSINLEHLSSGISHILFSLILNFAVFCSLYFSYSIKNRILKLLFLILSIWFTVYIFFEQSLSGIIAFVLIFIALCIFIASKLKNKLIVYGAVVLNLAVILFLFAIAFKEYRLFAQPKDIAFNKLPQFNANKHKFIHTLDNDMLENGHHVGYYLCTEELRRQWNFRSKIDYDSGNDSHGYLIKYTLIRYLTSKGLTKDSLGVASLTKKDIFNIEQSLTNYRFSNKFSLNKFFYKIFWQLYFYKHTDNPNNQSLSQRYEYLITAGHIIKKHLIFGVGTGDFKNSFKLQFEKDKSNLLPENRLYVHNQIITFIILFGVFLGVWNIFAIFFPIFTNKKYKEFVPLTFVLIFFIYLLTDNALDTTKSTTFVTLFYSLLILHKKSNNDNKTIN